MVLVLTLIFGFAIAAVSYALVEAAVPPGPAALDAERGGDQQLVELFRRAQAASRKGGRQPL